MLELNKHAAAQGTEDRMSRMIQAFKNGNADVFRGEYTGVDPDDPEDTIDLRDGFEEDRNTSSPSFHYILDDVIIEVE
jgi:basic membrane protein A